ncbi:MAG: carboxypeptidase regulatory-like domain-containing protein [Ardenticatenaceae bacterium]|nr:carboxypeptidase regulatory-like domain-containing protein [Ardenticatenaceae bacterium]
MVEVDSDGGYNQTVEVVDVYLTNIAPDMDSLTGMAPANSKVELYVYDDFIGDNAGLVATATAAGMFTADFSGIYDILPGGYGSPIYHDAQDNEVANAGLYAGPYVKAYFNSYTDLNVVGDPHQPIEATLRNALGAIKATASATTGVNGYSSFSFYDSIGNHVDVLPNDVVDVVYGDSALQAGGVFTRTVTAVDIDFVIDRNNKTVYGTGPANSMLRLVYDWGTQTADVPTDGNGDFTYTFGGVLNGNYNFDITYRNGAGDDLYTWGRVPQFTAVYENNNIYGYGVGDNIVVATLKDYNGNIKSTANTTTSRDGWYWLYLDGPISLTDIIEVDTGPLHFSQDIVALTLDADTTNNIVYGTAPPNAWLNVFDENSFGPYALYNYKYFSADGLGNYTAAFAEVYGGDSLQVIYWEGGHYDRVSMGRNTPGLFINHVTDNVYLYAGTLDAVGTITIRDSSNAIKASATITAQNTSANVNYWPDVNIVPGDSVEVNIGELVQTSDVIPLSGSLNLNTDTVSGTSLPNKPIGVEAYHWNGTSYSQYVGAGTLSQFASSNGSGAFSANFSGYVDLTAGDYMGLFFIDEMDTHYQAHFYTTNPTIATTEYPTAVQPYASVPIETTISNGQHVQTVYVYWDTVSHAADNDYASLHAGASGAIGPNIVVLYAPAGGTIYFKTAARVDGQLVWESTEHTITVDGTTATTIYAPVSGTTNDTTPEIRAVAPPNAFVTLYDGNDVAVMTKTADANGRVTFNLTTPLNPGSYEFYAVAAVSGTAGPASNTLHLAVDPTLPVDPVNILVTANGRKQHLRDANGYANLGGRVWTRTGDSVAISIPISATGVISAELYVGGVFDSALINSGNDVYLGSYTPPTTGAYSLDLKLYTGTTQTINILTGLIDPDGYVYDASLGADYRLAGAVVTCYEWVEGEWLVWNGAIWGQSNAQTTAADGYYAFFTLPGDYKVVVSADGYGEYESPVLTVVDAPVHHNVALWPIHELYLPFVVKP